MILDEILAYRKIQLENEKERISPDELENLLMQTSRTPKDFAKALKKDHLTVIAEVKKASPSKGVIQPDFHPVRQATSYQRAGAEAISCLTEEHYFMGNSDIFKRVRKAVQLPMLRKDFLFDPYQILEARVMGADAVLLIAAMLEKDTLKELYDLAKSLSMEVLVEVHNLPELEKAMVCNPKVIGINNRDLNTFQVDLNTTARLAEQLPKDAVKVSESGMATAEDFAMVRQMGADAVLVGETLMRSQNIAETLKGLRTPAGGRP